MPNLVRCLVENPDEILNAGLYGSGAIIRVQTGATETGSFADVSGTGSTPTLPVVTLVRSYVGYDPNGITSSWYRTRYENAGATRLSDWSAAFQVGDETAGLLCSLYDVKQELGDVVSTADDELIMDKIRQVSAAIERYVGQWLAPRPTNPASTTTLLFDVTGSGWNRRSLLLERGGRLTGIRTLTALGIATTSQPETAGTYTAATVADVLLRPAPTADGPALRLFFTDYPTGSQSLFYPGFNTVQVTGSFGPAVVPYDVQGVAIRAVTRRVLGKAAGGVSVAVGPSGTEFLLPDMSGADRQTLDMIRIQLVS